MWYETTFRSFVYLYIQGNDNKAHSTWPENVSLFKPKLHYEACTFMAFQIRISYPITAIKWYLCSHWWRHIQQKSLPQTDWSQRPAGRSSDYQCWLEMEERSAHRTWAQNNQHFPTYSYTNLQVRDDCGLNHQMSWFTCPLECQSALCHYRRHPHNRMHSWCDTPGWRLWMTDGWGCQVQRRCTRYNWLHEGSQWDVLGWWMNPLVLWESLHNL